LSCQNLKTESPLDLFLSNPNFKNVITQAAFQSKDCIVQSSAIQILSLMLRQILEDANLDQNLLLIDI
jgi:hypothetical protein